MLTTILSGCGIRDAVDFRVNEDLVLKTRMQVEEDQQRTVHRYEIERPVAVQKPDAALILEFPAHFAGARLTVEGEDTVFVEADLDAGFVMKFMENAGDAVGSRSGGVPAQGNTAKADGTPAAAADYSGKTAFAVPLPPGTKFDGFSLHYPAVGDAARPASPSFAGVGATVDGVVLEPKPRIDTRVGVTGEIGNPHRIIIFDVSRMLAAAEGIAGIAIDYRYLPQDDEICRVTITVEDETNSAGFNLRLREGETSVHLYEGMLGFGPAVVSIGVEGSGFTLESLLIDEIPLANGAAMKPIPIDMRGVVDYDRSRWRNGEFELFSWNIFPDILIVDTASYEVQSEFFKRLAFFVEKAGTAGSLLPDSAIADRHGWNAHDYRAEDLARFFSRARIEDFELGDREILLRDMLVNRGIIHRADGGWQAGKGGLLSLSQESSARLRELFMAHEGYHGIYFIDADYREVSLAVWKDLSPLEQRFWREFLRLREYNVNDEFLVVNEFQAYLMQVSHDVLEAYYWDYTVPGLVQALPRTAAMVDQLQRLYPDTFHSPALIIESYLEKTYGFGAADLFCLEPARR